MDELSHLWMCNYVDDVEIDNGNVKMKPDWPAEFSAILFSTDMPTDLRDIWQCNWNHFMALPLTSKLMQNITSDEQFDLLETNATEVLSIAISSLQLFVQQNFIGPYKTFIPDDLHSSNELRSKLQINGVDLNVNVENPELLLLSMNIFKSLLKSSPNNYILQWWYLRILYIYSDVLDEPSESLFKDFGVYSEELLKRSDDLPSNETKALLVLEITQQYLAYKRVHKAEQHLDMARNLLNANFEVKGTLQYIRVAARNA